MAKKENATASLILGILSLIFWLLPILGAIVAAIGLVLAIQDKKKGKIYAQGALVCSAIGLVLSIVNGAIGALLALYP